MNPAHTYYTLLLCGFGAALVMLPDGHFGPMLIMCVMAYWLLPFLNAISKKHRQQAQDRQIKQQLQHQPRRRKRY